MNLKDKFDSHTEALSDQAWEDFQLMREKKKRKPVVVWLLLLGILLLVIGAVVKKYWSIDHHRGNDIAQSYAIDLRDSSSLIFTNGKQKDREKSQLESYTIGDSSDNHFEESLISKSIDTKLKSLLSKSNDTLISNYDYKRSRSSQLNNNEGESGVYLQAGKIKDETASIVIEAAVHESVKGKNTIALKENLVQNEGLASGKKNVVDPIAIIDALPIEKLTYPLIIVNLEVENKSIPKDERGVQNSIRFQTGYGPAYVNGFSLENPVDKKALSVTLGYRRDFGSIISLGIRGGYIPYRDKDNPNDPQRDKELITFLHADLYFNLLNTEQHRLYGMLGAGPTRTNRRLGAFFVDINGELSRVFQINTISGIGMSVEGGYEYNASDNLCIGVYYNIISHNDGGWNIGLSVGHDF